MLSLFVRVNFIDFRHKIMWTFVAEICWFAGTLQYQRSACDKHYNIYRSAVSAKKHFRHQYTAVHVRYRVALY